MKKVTSKLNDTIEQKLNELMANGFGRNQSEAIRFAITFYHRVKVQDAPQTPKRRGTDLQLKKEGGLNLYA